MADIHSTDIVALIFDFDDTLAPDSTTRLLEKHGINASTFWKRSDELIAEGYDSPAAFLRLLLADVKNLTNAQLREFGALFGPKPYPFYDGVLEFFDDVEKLVAENSENIAVEFFIISGGLYEIVSSTPIAGRFKGIYGCHLGGDTEDGVLKYIKRTVTFTEKTRYIFEINKGIPAADSFRDPKLVNEVKAPDKRRIPIKNMIYVGDGLTDIPCFTLVKMNGGIPFGVFDPESKKKTKQALDKFMQPGRVVGMFEPDFRDGKALGSMLRVAVANKCSEIELNRNQPPRP
jgi:phosphoserine phosphatase